MSRRRRKITARRAHLRAWQRMDASFERARDRLSRLNHAVDAVNHAHLRFIPHLVDAAKYLGAPGASGWPLTKTEVCIPMQVSHVNPEAWAKLFAALERQPATDEAGGVKPCDVTSSRPWPRSSP